MQYGHITSFQGRLSALLGFDITCTPSLKQLKATRQPPSGSGCPAAGENSLVTTPRFRRPSSSVSSCVGGARTDNRARSDADPDADHAPSLHDQMPSPRDSAGPGLPTERCVDFRTSISSRSCGSARISDHPRGSKGIIRCILRL